MTFQISARSMSTIKSSQNKQFFNQSFQNNSTFMRPPSTRSLVPKSKINAIKNQNIIKKVNEKIEKLNIEVKSEELTKINVIQDEISKIFDLTKIVIRDNVSIPNVINRLSPVLKTIKQSYETFHELSTEFFSTLAVIQKSASDKNQVLSTSSVRVSRDVFEKDWKKFCLEIKTLFNSKPPPQSKEIKLKINSILSSLQYIQITNENRKNPAQHLTEYISYVGSLCNQLYQNIMNLFTQQIFPNFESNILTFYITNVRTFIDVINNSFSNEFMQCGILFSDLSRLKSSIFADCNDIIKSLKLAFNFSHQLYEIKCLNEDLTIKIDEILRKLSGPYVRVFAKDGDASEETNPNQQLICLKELDIGFSSEEPEEEEDEQETLESFIRKAKDTKVNNDSELYYKSVIKVRSFLKSFYSIIQVKPFVSGDVWEDLNSGIRSIQEFKDRFDEQTKTIKKHESTIQKLNETILENEEYFQNQKEMYKDKSNEQKTNNDKLANDIKCLSTKCEELENTLKDKNKEINSLITNGDPLILRKALSELGSLFISDEEINAIKCLNDQEMIEKLREYLLFSISSNKDSILEYEKSLNEISDRINSCMKFDQIDILKSLEALIQKYQSKEKENNDIMQKFNKMKQILDERSKMFCENEKLLNETNLSIQLKTIFEEYEKQIEHEKDRYKELEQYLEANNENNQNELHNIYSQLKLLMPENKEKGEIITNESIHQQIKTIENKLNSMKANDESKTNQIDILEKDINQALKRLYYLVQLINSSHNDDPVEFIGTNNKDQSLNDAVNNIELIIQHYETLINKLNVALGNIENELITIDIRLKGVLRLKNDKNVEKQSSAAVISSIYDNIEKIQDQKETFQTS